MIACEVASFLIWIRLLSTVDLGAAFPISALCYVAVLGSSWLVFHEPASMRQLLGSAAILAGVWLIGTEETERGD